jgi:hypothetical protein
VQIGGKDMALDQRLRNINTQALSELKDAYQKGRLTIVVGAGSSAQSGLPTWNGVLKELLAQYVQENFAANPFNFFIDDIRDFLSDQLGGQSPIVFAQYIKSQLSEDKYIDLVYKSLYGSLQSNPSPGPIAQAIARLGGKINSVITFNYDELIEDAFQKNKFTATSVWNPSDLSSFNGIPVYHPHGFLPFNRIKGVKYWIVFSEDEYHSQYLTSLGWNNVTIASALLKDTCLFVSTTITDPNLRRIIDCIHREAPNKKNYFVWSRPEPSIKGMEAMLNDVYEKIFKSSFECLGLFPVWFFHHPNTIDEWSDIPELIDEIS